jgi:hypothetical protein
MNIVKLFLEFLAYITKSKIRFKFTKNLEYARRRYKHDRTIMGLFYTLLTKDIRNRREQKIKIRYEWETFL